MRPNFRDISGTRIGHLTVLRYDHTDKKRGATVWLVRCDCGREFLRLKGVLQRGRIKSCGCRKNENPRRLSLEQAAQNQVYSSNRAGARKRGHAWDLPKDVFLALAAKECAYCGAPPSNLYNHRGATWRYNGVDRVDNSIGYTPTNLVPCCKSCNRTKHQKTRDEFISYLRQVTGFQLAAFGAPVPKVWGEEFWLVNAEYCAKVLRVKPGFRCSLHLHRVKKETFLLLSGHVLVELWPIGVERGKFLFLEPGQKIEIEPGVRHRFGSEGGALILEVSTHHEDSDCVRFEPSGPIPADVQ